MELSPARGEVCDEIFMDCLGFVILVRKLMGDMRVIPRFTWNADQLQDFLRPYNELEPGDIVLFRRKKITTERQRTRFFTHMALKFGQTHVAHLSHPKGPTIDPLEDLLKTRVLLHVT